MRPDDTTQPQDANPRGAVSPPARDHSPHHNAVANMTREQINQIYSQQVATDDPSDPQQPNAYQRTHSDQHEISQADWQKYHSSWQDYYQKYYERYYVGAVHQAHQTLQQQASSPSASQQPTATKEGTISKEEALDDLRSQLRTKIQNSAKKARGSRHFMPIVSALVVLLVFGFLQYNTVIIGYAKAYVSPGNIDPQNIIVDPSASLAVGPGSRLIIPKLNIDVGVDYGAKPDPQSQIDAMRKNVAYFGISGANSKPGQNGNTPIAGHSSNEWYTTGEQELKFVFVRLHELKKGDIFYLNYKGTRYTYTVTKHLVVLPKDIGSLRLGNDKPYATLITCTPIGTAEKRLLVVAEQISPAPNSATKAPTDSGQDDPDAQLVGQAPTLIEWLFGAGQY